VGVKLQLLWRTESNLLDSELITNLRDNAHNKLLLLKKDSNEWLTKKSCFPY